MNMTEACGIVDEISVLKFFPANPAARAALANKLIGWCQGDIRQARWLVDHGIEGMDEYPGPETLRRMIAEKFRPVGPLAKLPPLVRPRVDCDICSDSGTRYDEAARKHAWCDCEAGKRVQAETPGWLDIVNMMQGSRHREAERARQVQEAIEKLSEIYPREMAL